MKRTFVTLLALVAVMSTSAARAAVPAEVPADALFVAEVDSYAQNSEKAVKFLSKIDSGLAMGLKHGEDVPWFNPGRLDELLDISKTMYVYATQSGRRISLAALASCRSADKWQPKLKSWGYRPGNGGAYYFKAVGKGSYRFIRLSGQYCMFTTSSRMMRPSKGGFSAEPSLQMKEQLVGQGYTVRVYINSARIDQGVASVVGSLMPGYRPIASLGGLYSRLAMGIRFKEKAMSMDWWGQVADKSQASLPGLKGGGLPQAYSRLKKTPGVLLFGNMDSEAMLNFLEQGNPGLRRRLQQLEQGMQKNLAAGQKPFRFSESLNGQFILAVNSIDPKGSRHDLTLMLGFSSADRVRQFRALLDATSKQPNRSLIKRKKYHELRIGLQPVFYQAHGNWFVASLNAENVRSYGAGGAKKPGWPRDDAAFAMGADINGLVKKLDGRLPLEFQVLLIPLMNLSEARAQAWQEGKYSRFSFELTTK